MKEPLADRVTVWDIHSAVYDKFNGAVPANEWGQIDLSEIVIAVLDVLAEFDLIETIPTLELWADSPTPEEWNKKNGKDRKWE